jgi:NADH dehydrogenase
MPFACALLDAAHAVPATIQGAARRRADRRFAVYRNNVVAGLIDALAQRFPVVCDLVGDEFFRAMAHVYATARPPASPLMMLYGETFPAFIDEFLPAATLPYLGDIARLELARGRAYHAADAAPAGAQIFAGLGGERLGRLRVKLHPSAFIVASSHPIVSIWQVNNDPDHAGPIAPWAAETALVARPIDRRQVIAEDHRVAFDTLIVAAGAQHGYFGHDDWARYAPGLKTIDDATYLRRRILLAFEKAEIETDPVERRRLLNFVIVGGGPTGVEMAGAVAELAKRALASDFRAIDPRHARIILVEVASRLLTPFDPSLSDAAKISLERLGVEVRVNVGVTAADCAGVSLGEERIEARTIMWAAGVMASPAGRWLGAETDRAGRVLVGPDLSVTDHPDIFVIGDTAHVLGANGMPLPGVAPVAKQQGAYVAALIEARAKGRTLPPFRYRDLGSLATIGRKRAVAQLGSLKLSGFVAWPLWSVAHIYFLIGFRNRAVVAMNWAWNYVTFQRGTRLITGMSGAREDMPRPATQPPAQALITGKAA